MPSDEIPADNCYKALLDMLYTFTTCIEEYVLGKMITKGLKILF